MLARASKAPYHRMRVKWNMTKLSPINRMWSAWLRLLHSPYSYAMINVHRQWIFYSAVCVSGAGWVILSLCFLCFSFTLITVSNGFFGVVWVDLGHFVGFITPIFPRDGYVMLRYYPTETTVWISQHVKEEKSVSVEIDKRCTFIFSLYCHSRLFWIF